MDKCRPYKEGYLDVDNIHSIYYSCYGNPSQKSVLIFHGGPGYGCEIDMLLPFNVSKWNIIMFDQRGCGNSRPRGETINNTTDLLVEDVKKLADHLNITTFCIKAESWGTTLALLFAEKYPEYVSSMILTGVFLGDNNDTLLGLYGGFERYYPEYWNHYISLLPPEKRDTPYLSYYDYIFNGTIEEQEKYSKELVRLELLIEMEQPNDAEANEYCNETDCISIAKIETYYTVNNFFVIKEDILNNTQKLDNIPVSIVQGRHDLICPIYSAWLLSQQLKKCRFIVSEMGTHSDFSGNTLKLLQQEIENHRYLSNIDNF